MPGNLLGGELELTLVATDFAGHSVETSVSLPVADNEDPTMEFKQFASYKVNGRYTKILTEPERLNYAEFWVRIGETFNIGTQLVDDAGLARYSIYRLNRDGSRVAPPEYEETFGYTCPAEPTTRARIDADISFNQVEPTEYELEVQDTFGNRISRTILVHPLTNVTPQVRITGPADGQFIVAGTFRIKVGVVATDDRQLSGNSIKLFANGVPLGRLGNTSIGDAVSGGDEVIEQAFEHMYDAIERDYTVDIADDYGTRDSPYALEQGFVMSVPAGLIRFNETITLTAQITDSDGAIGTHEIGIVGAADEINPEVAILQPEIGFGPPEASDFTVAYRGYDNVKVEQLELFTTYGVLLNNGTYDRIDFGEPVRRVQGIPDADFEPVTTVNIDTPVYSQFLRADRLVDILSLFPGVGVNDVTRFDIWVKVAAVDGSGNRREAEVSYPVRVDERPVIDVVAPQDNSRVVEESKLFVNVQAFDDVGIQYVRMVATYRDGRPPFELRLRQPPYSFLLDMPVFDPDVPSNNFVDLALEAVDTYGAAFGDLDRHIAEESLTVEIIEDKPPVVAIGLPVNDSSLTEGENMLVQVNAVDDLGIDHVVVNVAGLITGDRSFTDTTFPFEFLVPVPFGQAGNDLTLTATATEQRVAGKARTIATAQPTIVRVDKDDGAPEIIVHLPALSGTTVVEKRSLPYQMDIDDNVRVTFARVTLFADRNLDGSFAEDEAVVSRVLLTPPYAGSLALETIDDWLDPGAPGVPDQLPLMFRVITRDGVGNEAIVERPAVMNRNTPPEVTGIQILDSRGFSLGAASDLEVTEGRGIIVQVAANDPEVGVDLVALFQGNAADPADIAYGLVGDDGAAPFQFHVQIPTGAAGQVFGFAAQATDIDGFESSRSAPRTIRVVEDKPPTARIVKPENDNSVIIDGQDIEIFVEAIDDLGISGIDRVVFYVNDRPVITVFENYASLVGGFALEHIYRAVINAPEGVDGFFVKAIAYDVLGHGTETQTVLIGRIADTVKPKINLLSPFDREILTTAETVRAVVAVEDIGVEAERFVFMDFFREYQDPATAEWTSLNETTIELFRDDARPPGDDTPVSEPDNDYYVYWADFTDGNILRRSDLRNERVRIVTRVETPNHNVGQESLYEVGLPIAESRFIAPSAGSQASAKKAYYTAVDQYRSAVRTGAMVTAWSTVDPMRIEQGLGNLGIADASQGFPEGELAEPRTGIFLIDAVDESQGNEEGDFFVYSDLLNGAAEIFAGTIGEIDADANFVLAGKSGVTAFDLGGGSPFVSELSGEIARDPDTGGVFVENTDAELLIFNTQNGDGQFGLPYLLQGRIDLPFPDVYGLDRLDDLAFVANGNGGVQVIDISNLASPYHVGFIKPNGFARDVKISGNYAVIAASFEGVVIADISDPTLPIIGKVDTLGAANRLHVVGDRAFVTDMSADGAVSQLNIVDISNPFLPEVVRTVELAPARRDLVSDGVYEVRVAGNLAFVTVHYSDQEDQPAQAVVEVIDLEKLDEPGLDPTIPVMIHRNADITDFAARDMVLARGAMQVASGRGGIKRIELSELTVIQTTPLPDEEDVPTNLQTILVELSAVLDDPVVPGDWVQVIEGDPLIGVDVTDRFTVDFMERNGEPARRFIELTRDPAQELLSNTAYYVIVKAGLTPLTGNALARDYQSAFFTSPAGSAPAPDIDSICTTATIVNQQGYEICSAAGGIEGGTELVVRGTNFGASPQLILGGQSLVVQDVQHDINGQGFDYLYVTTAPNFAGPAAVTVINDAGLSDTVIGGFTYVDILQISFIDPAVVNVNQRGENDEVSIVGFGFHPGIELRAWKSGDPASAVTDTVDDDRLQLYSAERMTWVVPDFGESYRGFVDVEITDEIGRRYVLQNAVFYGRLIVDRTLETEEVFSRGFIEGELRMLESRGVGSYIPDALKLPPGEIVAFAADRDLRLIYVLGRGILGKRVPLPSSVRELAEFQHLYAPGWISLVHYAADDIENAAPMHGLGYFNLPQDLIATNLFLADDYLYVTATGYDFPFVNTPFEGQSAVLVYDREDRLPGSGGTEQPDGKDRDVLYSLPLPVDEAPREVLVREGLMFVNAGKDGVVVASLADPRRPSVIRVMRDVTLAGRTTALDTERIELIGDTLHVVTKRNERVVFDITKPSMPQLGDSRLAGLSTVLRDQERVATTTSGDLSVYDASRPNHLRFEGQYFANGFSIPGATEGMDAQVTVPAKVNRHKIDQDCEKAYVSLFDASRTEQINLLDALVIDRDCGSRAQIVAGYGVGPWAHHPMVYTDDGLVVVARNRKDLTSHMKIIETLILDLVDSYPAAGARGIPLDQPLRLNFTQQIALAGGDVLADFVRLVRDDGAAQPNVVAASVDFDATDPRRVTIVPDQNLDPNAAYYVELLPALGSRRTRGAMAHRIEFTTGVSTGPQVELLDVAPTIVATTGGEVVVRLRFGDDPGFVFSSAAGVVLGADPDPNDAEITSYRVLAPANLPGPAELRVINGNGSEVTRIGAVQYVEPLVANTLSPGEGSVNGGTTVTIRGKGFRPGLGNLAVTFGGIPADPEQIKVIDTETVQVVTPGGSIGVVDVEVSLSDGQVATLEGAFRYLQPIQSNIEGEGRLYDITQDPTGTFLLAAAGSAGVVIYNTDASTFTGREDQPLNVDDLRRLIDEDGDEVDDRILTTVPLPGGYAALGIRGFFEKGNDRVFVTAARLTGGTPSDAHLFIISFDSVDITQSTIVKSLELPASYAKGLEVEQNHTVVAMGEAGIGIVDSYLYTKAYLNDRFALPGNKPALDVTRLPVAPGEASRYVAVGGAFDFGANRLTEREAVGGGGFYTIELDPVAGMRVLGTLDIPASRVVVAGGFAYLAAGDGGMVIVDIRDPFDPKIVARVTEAGPVHDVDVNGNVAYMALGEAGVLTVDVTNPFAPALTDGMEAFDGNNLDVVLATNYSAITAGFTNRGASVVQVIPDVVLKIHGIDPTNGILDLDTDGERFIRLRFKKAIDLYPDNLTRFSVTGPAGAIPFSVEIVNNDAMITLDGDSPLAVGDLIAVVAQAGIANVKPVATQSGGVDYLVLYELGADQRFELTYRGNRPDELRVEAVVPRRVQRDTEFPVTIGVLGAPADPARVRVFLGGVEAAVTQIETNDDAERAAIIHATVPGFASAGQYDVLVEMEKAGLWQSAVLRGGLVIDAPIRLDSLTPLWGPFRGGTRITVTGQGFEPGNTVMEGLKLKIGSIPVRSIDVPSTELIYIVAAGGEPGRHPLIGEDRYGNESRIEVGVTEGGFGYGIKQIATTRPSLAFPTDIEIDRETGVAVTAAGYFNDGNGEQTFAGLTFPETTRAATFDVQDPFAPLLVGGASSLPSGPEGRAQLANLDVETAIDSIRVQPTLEMEEGVLRKRLYVAAGGGGVTRLNLDEQNGLQFINEIKLGSPTQHVTEVFKRGPGLFALLNTGMAEPPKSPECASRYGPGDDGTLEQVNYIDPFDPVDVGRIEGMTGGTAMHVSGQWLYSGGNHGSWAWVSCPPTWRTQTAGRASDSGEDTITAINLFDQALTRQYSFTNTVQDIVRYGDHLIVATSGDGVEIFHRDRPQERTVVALDGQLQQTPGRAVRLEMLGSTLLASADAGLVVIDVRDPQAPFVVSAGNTEHVEAVNVYKDRVIAGAGKQGLRVFQLPAALVADASVAEGGLLSLDPGLPLTVEFNELIAVDSLLVPDVVEIDLIDATDGSRSPVAVTVTAIDPETIGELAATRYQIDFARDAGARYELRINDARNLRGTGLWTPFARRFGTTTELALQPAITHLENNAFHAGAQSDVIVHGSGFGPGVNAFINHNLVPVDVQDENTLVIPEGAIDLLNLAPGHYHLRLDDSGLTTEWFGAVVIGDALELNQLAFDLNPDSGSELGGVTANADVIMPGSRVVMRSRSGLTEIYTGFGSIGENSQQDVIDLNDDVVRLNRFEFTLPGVIEPDLYDVFLRIPSGDATVEIAVGKFSYTLPSGRSIDLPNYPPMIIGAAETLGDIMVVGVKAGARQTSDNRFLMQHGLEIYDVAIWDRPIRLAQLRTEQPVYGLATLDDVAYLASARDGLVVVDIHDYSKPLIVDNFPLVGARAMDVDLHEGRKILAMAVADDLGGGQIRFFDARSEELSQPGGFDTLLLDDDSVDDTAFRGQPVDVEWQGDELYILFYRDNRQYLAVASYQATGPPVVEVHPIERGIGSDITEGSLLVHGGQVYVTSSREYLILERSAGGAFETIYWQELDSTAHELLRNVGGVFTATNQGVVNNASNQLVLSGVSPAAGSTLANGETLRFQFNSLINTSEASLAAAFVVTDGAAAPLPAGAFTLTGINTLAGAYVDVQFDTGVYQGDITISVTNALLDIQGRELFEGFTGDYTVSDGFRPRLSRVVRDFDGAEDGQRLHYFHGTGDELAIAFGANFGVDAAQLRVFVGNIEVAGGSITLISDGRLEFTMPELRFGVEAAALPVRVERLDQGLDIEKFGAIVLLPELSVEDINPQSGTPQGGNFVDIFGRGFNHSMVVRFGGSVAGDLQVLSSGKVKVRVPAGSFGFVPVTVENLLFPGEISTSPIDYFYASRETGTVNLSTDKASAVAAIARQGQLLYAVTGGFFDAIDNNGALIDRVSSNVARLVLADISDPVHPVIVEKEFLNDLKPFHFDVTGGLNPYGFADIEIQGEDLFVIGGRRLYHFDITLATDPLNINTLTFSQDLRDVVVTDDLVFVSNPGGLHIYQITPDRALRKLDEIPSAVLGGVPAAMVVDGASLWIALPSANRVIEIDLLGGDYAPVRRVDTVDEGGNVLTPEGLLVRNELLMVSTGVGGSVQLYFMNTDVSATPVADLRLAYLVRNGDLFAGDMALHGQTLYVAGGQGDVQIFDISPWLDGRFQGAVDLGNYFSVTGNVGAIEVGAQAIYAGTAFAYVQGEPAENPIDRGLGVSSLGGGPEYASERPADDR